jgi:RNA polymerase sigma-70 factor (ECF subfamily)
LRREARFLKFWWPWRLFLSARAGNNRSLPEHHRILERAVDEATVIRASQAGDRQAFGTLVERYYRSVYRLAYHYAGNHPDADDVCQQTFLIALEKIGSLRDHDRFASWVLVIAANLLCRQVRGTIRSRRLFQGVRPEQAGSNVGASWQAVGEKERAEAVRRALQEMPEKVRLTAILVLMEGRCQKEVAGILHCSEATICRCVESARNMLKVNLRKLID